VIELAAGAVLAAAIAAFVQASTGFGFALAVIPLLVPLTGPQNAIAAGTMLSGLLTLAAGSRERSLVHWPTARVVILCGMAGMPLGLLALRTMNPRVLTLLIGCLVLLFSVVIARGRTVRARTGVTLVAGTLSGVLLTSTGMNGPPLVAALQAMRMEPRCFRATLQVVFSAQDAFAIGGFALAGLLTKESLFIVAVGAPTMTLGWALGDRVFKHTDRDRLRTIVATLLAVSGLAALAQATF